MTAEILFYGVLGLFAVYLAARLIFVAYFKTKQQHERENHGPR